MQKRDTKRERGSRVRLGGARTSAATLNATRRGVQERIYTIRRLQKYYGRARRDRRFMNETERATNLAS